MRRIVLGVTLVVACAPPPHVAIEIDAPSEVQRVELYIAPHRCDDDDRVTTGCQNKLAWDVAPRPIDGEPYILDINTLTVADRRGDGTFRIDLKRDAMEQTDRLERVLFVGYGDPDGVTEPKVAAILESVDLPANTTASWRIRLDPVEQLPPPTANDVALGRETQRIHMWNRRADSLGRCVVLERWVDGGKKVKRDFLLPHDDTDCDDVAEPECDPFWWNAPAATSSPDEAECVTTSTRPGVSSPLCLLGGFACSETDPASSGMACVPATPTHCLAKALCDDRCLPMGESCFGQLDLAQVYCDVPVDQAGNPCPQPSDRSTFLGLSLLASNQLADCGPVSMGPFEVPFQGFTNPATLGGITLTASQSGNLSMPCSVDIAFDGHLPNGALEFGLMRIGFPNNTAAVVGLKVNVAVGTCDTKEMACSLYVSSGDSVKQCSLLPIASP